MSTKMIAFVSKEIISHVKNGGWIGASWPQYIAGANALDNDGLALALGQAEREYFDLWQESQDNFEECAEV